MKLKFLENFQSSAHSSVKIELITKQRVVKSCHQLLPTTYTKKRKCAKNLPFEYSIMITDSTGKSLSEALLFAEHGENMLCTKIVLNIRNKFCIQHDLLRFELKIFMY